MVSLVFYNPSGALRHLPFKRGGFFGLQATRIPCSLLQGFLFAAVFALFAASCAGKQIPEPAAVDPEPPRPSFTEGSLWPGEEVHGTLFADNKAARAGDIITVHLVENTTASNKASTIKERQQKNDIKISTGDIPTEIGLAGGSRFRGGGDTSRSEKLVSTVSVMVVEVLPNGNLQVDGRRKIRINNADQYVRVKGFVRREDINYDNSVLSTKIANAEITYDGVGDLDKQQKSGWMGRALDAIWPF